MAIDTWIYIPTNAGGYTDATSGEVYRPGAVAGFDSTDAAQLAEANRILAAGAGVSFNAFVQLIQIAWGNVTGKPASFTPSAHTHAASEIVSGTLADPRISQSSVTQHQAALVLAIAQVTGLQSALDAKLAATLKGAALGLAELDAASTVPLLQVPSLPASKIGSGEFDLARVPSLPASKIGSGEFDLLRIPSLPASKVGSGTLADARISASAVRQHEAAIQPAWANVQGTPTTLGGYGITDAATQAEITTQINAAVAALVDGAPGLIDTLNELAAAIGDDPNFAATITAAIGEKLDASLWQAATATNLGYMTAAQAGKLEGIEAGATVDQTAEEIRAAYEGLANRNAYTDAEKTKLAGIETGATADQTGAEIKTAYEGEADTNAYTDAEKSKLAGVATGATTNQSDAHLLSRANHTGAQPISTVTGLQTALDDRPLISDLPFASIAQYSSTDAATDLAAGAIVRWNSAVMTDSAISVGGVNSDEITVEEAGKYRIAARLSYEDTSADGADVNNAVGVSITVNGVGVGRQGVGSPVVNANGQNEGAAYIEEVLNLTATDVVRVTTQRLSGGDELYLRSGESALIVERVGGKSALLAAQEISDIGGLQAALDAKLPSASYTAADVRAKVEAATDSNVFTDADHTKLDGIQADATANATDAALRARASHTGEQAISTVTGLQDALDAKIAASEKGAVSGVATLDAQSRIPLAQIPEGIGGGLTWVVTSAATGTLVAGQGEIVDASAGTRDRTSPASLAVGDEFVVHAQGGSVRINPNTGQTIRYKGVAIGGELLIEDGQTAHLVAGSTTTLEII